MPDEISAVLKEADAGRGEIVIYETSDGVTKLGVSLDEETVWLYRQHQ